MTHQATASPRMQAARISLLSAAAGIGLSLAAVAAPAWAHDSLISSSPEAEEVLERSPEEITLEFSGDGLTDGESIANVIEVSDAEGANWHGETEVEGSTLSADLPEELPGGEYTVAYRAVYSDGHAEEQSFDFEVADSGPGSAAGEPDTSEDDDAAAAPSEPAAEESTAEDPEAQQTMTQAPAEEVGYSVGVPTWAVVAGGIVVLGLIAGAVIAVLRGRARRRG
ncbi:copper resistance CopC family protein [Nesterenkonia lutea]|uniref:copper resistance CopC family protein n=1 Tax=Nesterenkonia lutea TaxID=272919 RepID=UPI0031DCE551